MVAIAAAGAEGVGVGHVDEGAGEVVGPAVVGADQGLGATGGVDEPGGAVATGVPEAADDAVGAADEEERGDRRAGGGGPVTGRRARGRRPAVPGGPGREVNRETRTRLGDLRLQRDHLRQAAEHPALLGRQVLG